MANYGTSDYGTHLKIASDMYLVETFDSDNVTFSKLTKYSLDNLEIFWTSNIPIGNSYSGDKRISYSSERKGSEILVDVSGNV